MSVGYRGVSSSTGKYVGGVFSSDGIPFVFSAMETSGSGNWWSSNVRGYEHNDDGWEPGTSGTTHYRTSGSYYSPSKGTDGLRAIIGTITAVNYYTITPAANPSDGTLGTVTGGGNIWEGESTTITATPASGCVIKSWSDGDTSGVGDSAAKTRTFSNIIADATITVAFEAYYDIVFDANGGENAPSSITKCVANGVYTIPTTAPSREGYKFEGWATSSEATEVEFVGGQTYSRSSISTAGESVTLYAVWSQATLTYDANGGKTTPEAIKYYGTVTLSAAIEKDGREFAGWDVDGTTYAANASYKLTADVTATAQWSTISFFNDDTTKGTISLLDITSATYTTVATQNANGYLIYTGVANHTYRVVCNVTNILYKEKGVYVDGTYTPSFEFTYTTGDVTGTLYYEAKNLYTIDTACSPTVGGSAAVTTPTAPDTTIGGIGYYVEGREVQVTASPSIGYEMAAYNIVDVDTGYSRADGTTNPVVFAEGLLTFNARVGIVFTRIKYSLSAAKDLDSAMAISSISISMDFDPVDEAEYGDNVVFKANVASGYAFDGWYLDGTRISTDATYTHTVISNVTLVAKAKVLVTVNLEYRDNRVTPAEYDETCSLAVNSTAVTELPYSFYVTLGESFSYVTSLGAITEGGENWKFNAWFAASDTLRENPLQYEQNGSISPTAAMSIVAEVTTRAVENTLTIALKNDETLADIDPTELGDVFTLTPDAKSVTTSSSGISFVYEGSKPVQIVASASITVGEEVLAFSSLKDSDSTTISEDTQCNYIVNRTKTIYAYYGSQGERTTTLTYGKNSNRAMGTFAIDGISNEDGSAAVEVTKARGQYVNVTAKPKNGYKFMGWYLSADCLGDAYRTASDVDILVVTQRTLYARFDQDENAVYEWEGTSENKVFTWRSKLYVASKPMNPSSIRIDTEGYPVSSVSVEMFSSPDSAPTATATLLNVGSQNMRRLPVRRMERYMQIEIENDQEVDAMFVGTSAGGLAV